LAPFFSFLLYLPSIQKLNGFTHTASATDSFITKPIQRKSIGRISRIVSRDFNLDHSVMVSFTRLAVLVALSSSSFHQHQPTIGVNGFIPQKTSNSNMPYLTARQMVAQPIEINGKTAKEVSSEE
jgi:hypothetical protein